MNRNIAKLQATGLNQNLKLLAGFILGVALFIISYRADLVLGSSEQNFYPLQIALAPLIKLGIASLKLFLSISVSVLCGTMFMKFVLNIGQNCACDLDSAILGFERFCLNTAGFYGCKMSLIFLVYRRNRLLSKSDIALYLK